MSPESPRRHLRHAVEWSVTIAASEWTDTLNLVTGNVSRGGLFIRSSRPPRIGTRLQINLTLPDGNVLNAEGEVVHSIAADRASSDGLASGFGFRFDEKHSIDLNLVEAIAASHTDGHYSRELRNNYVTLPAVVTGSGDYCAVNTTIHRLLEDDAKLRPSGGTQQDSQVVQLFAAEEPAAAPPARASRVPSAASAEIAIELGSPEDDEEVAVARTPTAVFSDDGLVYGVDFGTTFSSIALVSGNRIEIFSDKDGHAAIPSVVCYPESGPPIVGWEARERILTNPSTTVTSPKRIIGKQYSDPSVDQFIGTSPVRLAAGPGNQVVADLYGHTLAIPQICAEIFRKLIDVVGAASQRLVRRIVLSAPVAFQAERPALKRAAEIAGLEVLAMVDEPVAAAMAYCLGQTGERVVAVYDLGGGTFDFSLLHFRQKGGVEVIGSAGDPWLGGDDFDLALAEYVASAFYKQRKVDLRTRQVEWQRLLFLAEAAKLKLSVEQQARVYSRGLLMSIHGPIDLDVPVSRDLLDQLCGPLVDRSIETMESCFELTNIAPNEIHDVVLTGGMCRSPLVRARLQAYFGRELPLNVDPELAVVTGNAIYARFVSLRGESKSI